MPEKISVTIQDDGSIKTDFSGFEGANCQVADQELRTRLAQFGLQLEAVQIIPKPELLAAQGEAQEQLQRRALPQEGGRQ